MNTFGLLVGVSVFIAVGIIAIAVPEKIRGIAIRYAERSHSYIRPIYFAGFLKSQYYVPAIRIIGIISICCGLAVAIAHFLR